MSNYLRLPCHRALNHQAHEQAIKIFAKPAVEIPRNAAANRKTSTNVLICKQSVNNHVQKLPNKDKMKYKGAVRAFLEGLGAVLHTSGAQGKGKY